MFAIEMVGIAQQLRMRRMLIWEGAMLPRMQKPPSREQYTGLKPIAEPAGALDMRLRASVKGLRSISMKDYLSSHKAR